MRNKFLALWILIKWRFKYKRWYWLAARSLWYGAPIEDVVSYDGYSRTPIELDISPLAVHYVLTVPKDARVGQELIVVDGCPKCGFDVDVEVGFSVKCRNPACDYNHDIDS